MPKDLRSRLAELNSTLPWALPLLGLIAISVSFAAVLSRMTDGREVTDDGFLLLYLVRHPLFIWDSYETNYLGRQYFLDSNNTHLPIHRLSLAKNIPVER